MIETFVQASEPSSYTAWAKMSRSRLLSVTSAASSTATATDILPQHYVIQFSQSFGNFRKVSAVAFPHASAPTRGSFSTVMYLSAIAPLLLLPYAAAAGVHKLKLKKLDNGPINPSLESLYL